MKKNKWHGIGGTMYTLRVHNNKIKSNLFNIFSDEYIFQEHNINDYFPCLSFMHM